MSTTILLLFAGSFAFGVALNVVGAMDARHKGPAILLNFTSALWKVILFVLAVVMMFRVNG